MDDGPAPSDRRRPLRVIRRRRPELRASTWPVVEEGFVAAVIPAKDEAERIAATVRAVRAIPHVDLVLVVDDGSDDDTGARARSAGAVVVRHSQNRGKASAMETGAAVVAMRDADGEPARLLLFLDADLGETAVHAAPLVPPVLAGKADMSIATLPRQAGAGGRGIVTGFARKAILKSTGWAPRQPLSGQRCITRDAFDAASPLARGWGVETGLTIDVLRYGFAVVEVPCDLRHRPSGNDLAGQLHRAAQLRDVMAAVAARRLRRYPEGPRRATPVESAEASSSDVASSGEPAGDEPTVEGTGSSSEESPSTSDGTTPSGEADSAAS